ncbi:MAG: dihydrodipicolinate synthase family protein [Armatimonadetes bacterium]|nr:dihydrodipicolinate synthase family protein [Armatimonadota bacterium]MDE2206554.1 dihydrodipicolinate synthase family protein [Armatimonadota bacterium]
MSYSDPFRFAGCYAAIVTPFDGEAADCSAAAQHASWLLERGVRGLCPCGSSGEFLAVHEHDRYRLYQSLVAVAGANVPVIAGIWQPTMPGVIRVAQAAAAAGAAALFLQPPIYYPVDDCDVYRWYTDAAAAAALPVFAYHIPQQAINGISLESYGRLTDDGILSGIKDSSGDERRVATLIEKFGERSRVFAGGDHFCARAAELGAAGFISALANVAPELVSRIWSGERNLQPRLTALRDAVKPLGTVAAIKYLLAMRGLPVGTAVYGAGPPTTAEQAELTRVWHQTMDGIAV